MDSVSGQVLAHACSPRNGNVHFDNAETWTEGESSGINFRLVAVHGIEHAIGLVHDDDYYSLMAPMYHGYTSEQDCKLHDYPNSTIKIKPFSFIWKLLLSLRYNFDDMDCNYESFGNYILPYN